MWNRSPYYERLMTQLNKTDYETTGQWPSAADIQEQEILEVDQEDRVCGKKSHSGQCQSHRASLLWGQDGKRTEPGTGRVCSWAGRVNWSDPRPVSWGGCPHTWGFTILCYIHYTKVAHSQPWSITNHSDAFLTHILFELRSFKNLDFCFPLKKMKGLAVLNLPSCKTVGWNWGAASPFRQGIHCISMYFPPFPIILCLDCLTSSYVCLVSVGICVWHSFSIKLSITGILG